MNFFSNKKGFLGVDNKFNFKEKPVVVPFGLEKTSQKYLNKNSNWNIIIN